MIGEIVELGPRERDLHVQRAVLADRDIRQADRRRGHGRELDLGLFGGLADALHRGGVAREIDFVLRAELLDEVVHDALVEVVAAQMVVARCGEHLDDARRDVEDRHVERAAAQVVDHDLLGLLAVDAVGQRGRGGLVDDALHLEPRDLAGVLGRLALGVGEVGGHRDDGVGDGLAEIGLGVPLELLQDHRGDLLRGVLLVVDVDAEVGAHVALDGRDGAVAVRDGLALCHLADHALAGLGEGHDGRGGAVALCVRDDDGFAALHDGDAAVGGAKVNADNFTHNNLSSCNLCE